MEIALQNGRLRNAMKNNVTRKKVIHFLVMAALAGALFIAMMHGCFAEDDLLKVGDTTVKATFGQDSSLMKWLLIGEVVMAMLAYVATKNFKILGGIIVLSVFINVAFAIIG